MHTYSVFAINVSQFQIGCCMTATVMAVLAVATTAAAAAAVAFQSVLYSTLVFLVARGDKRCIISAIRTTHGCVGCSCDEWKRSGRERRMKAKRQFPQRSTHIDVYAIASLDQKNVAKPICHCKSGTSFYALHFHSSLISR